MQEMSFGHIGRIQWGPTLKLAAARSIASAVVLTLLMAVFGRTDAAHLAGFFLQWSLLSALGVPLTSLLIKGLNGMFASMGLGIAVLAGNLILFGLSLAVASGDPLVFGLVRQFPEFFGVAEFNLFNLRPTIFIVDDGAPASAGMSKADMI